MKNVVATRQRSITDVEKMRGATGIILAGGKNLRLRVNKLSLRVDGELILEKMLELFGQLFEKTLVSVAATTRVRLSGCEIVKDQFPGSLGGIYSGLNAARTDVAFVAACDMPFINRELVRYEAGFAWDYDVVVPRGRDGLEPLHAFYSRNCLEHIRAQLCENRLTITSFFDKVRVKEIGPDEIAQFDADGLSFFNINTQADLLKAEEIKRWMAVRS